MSLKTRVEQAIANAIAAGQGGAAPPKLAAALDYAVNPGGARIRPTILMSVAVACGDSRPEVSDAAAAALELIHCASLVHDDMPCSTMPTCGGESPLFIPPLVNRLPC